MINISVQVDRSQLDDFTRRLSRQNMEAAITRGIHKTGDETRRIVVESIDKKYHGGMAFFDSAVQDPQKAPMQCVIPIRGSKGGIGSVFGAGGGGSGKGKGGGKLRAYKLKKGAAGRISAKIVKGQTSILPARMSHQGGNAPFMLGGEVMTRRTVKRAPVVHVVGLAVPQMAATRARGRIERELSKELEKNVVAELERALNI